MARKLTSLRNYAFGAHAGTITSLGLVAGLEGMPGGTTAALESLLITGIAGNLEVALGIYMYQMSARPQEGDAFANAFGNFCAWLAIALSFAGIILVAQSPRAVVAVAIVWGIILLVALSYLVARRRHKNLTAEVLKHVGIGVMALAIGQGVRIFVPFLLR